MRANLIGPETTKLIKQVVKDCKICKKFSKSLAKPKIALPIASSFNEIVTFGPEAIWGQVCVVVHMCIYKVYTRVVAKEQESRNNNKCYRGMLELDIRDTDNRLLCRQWQRI